MKKFKVLLIGDRCIDEYRYGTVDRISPEAPVPVFKHSHTIAKEGMSENVKNNLEMLNIEVDHYFGDGTVKIRLIDSRSGQHIVRIDHDHISQPLTKDEWKRIFSKETYDAIVISDYNKGFISYEIVGHIIESAMLSMRIPVFVDTKKTDLHVFDGCYVKINSLEFSHARTVCPDLIVTNGANGATYKKQTFPGRPVDVVDVCGAGDTFLASLVYQYLNTNGDIEKAIQFANVAASITVQHSGVYAPSLSEINQEIRND